MQNTWSIKKKSEKKEVFLSLLCVCVQTPSAGQMSSLKSIDELRVRIAVRSARTHARKHTHTLHTHI